MKKAVFLLLVLCTVAMLQAQNVLPGYSGYWDNPKKITILDLIEFYPDKLPYLRNEIFARYGRPFTTKVYQDYFRAKRWYQEKGNFSESWLSQTDSANAEFISSVEQTIQSIDATAAQVLKNIEYSDGRAVLTFTSRQQLIWSDRDVDFGAYGLSGSNKTNLPWFAMGNWILVYQYNSYFDTYHVVAYKLDHASRKILASESGNVESAILEKLLKAQGRPIEK